MIKDLGIKMKRPVEGLVVWGLILLVCIVFWVMIAKASLKPKSNFEPYVFKHSPDIRAICESVGLDINEVLQ